MAWWIWLVLGLSLFPLYALVVSAFAYLGRVWAVSWLLKDEQREDESNDMKSHRYTWKTDYQVKCLLCGEMVKRGDAVVDVWDRNHCYRGTAHVNCYRKALTSDKEGVFNEAEGK